MSSATVGDQTPLSAVLVISAKVHSEAPFDETVKLWWVHSPTEMNVSQCLKLYPGLEMMQVIHAVGSLM
jgi:hypothetical protein